MSTTDTTATGDRLAAAFEQIHHERMAGLPILNPELRVAVVGGRDWQGHWLGVLVTPWCMNLLLVPRADSELARAAHGDKHLLDFPAGRFEFLCSPLEDIGNIATCSLFSPMQDFADQAAAEATAAQVVHALFQPESDTAAASTNDPAGSQPQPPKPTQSPSKPGLSRRNLLRGKLRSG